jgi:hypothetical protein
MSCEKTEIYCALGPPKSQPRTLDFEKERGCRVSERKGRGGKISIDSLEDLALSSKESNNDVDKITELESQCEPNGFIGTKIGQFFHTYHWVIFQILCLVQI